MTTRQAWKAVETVLSSAVLPLSLPLALDDNPPTSFTVPDTGGATLHLQSGAETPYASPRVGTETLVFTLVVQTPGGVGNGVAQDYATAVRDLFFGHTFLNPSGGAGVLICTRVQSDLIGSVADGRDLYQINVVLVFDNRSYH